MDLIDPNDLDTEAVPVVCPVCGGILSHYPARVVHLADLSAEVLEAVGRDLQDLGDQVLQIIKDHVAAEHSSHNTPGNW